MRKKIACIVGLVLLIAVEILRVYFIMPFPGSQHQNSIRIAYFLNNYINLFRVLGILLFLPPFLVYVKKAGAWKKVLLLLPVLLYLFIFYAFNFRFLADKMFYQPRHKVMATVSENKVDTNQLVIGIRKDGEARAYPIQIIGYHHQVRDSLGTQPIMVTYCTVCRTGRIYSPFVDGKNEDFRLVGMDHFNAMFEDAETGTWWRQVNGEAIVGPLKGRHLEELPSAQIRLSAWIRENPQTLILQPDKVFSEDYDDLKGFDSGTIKSSLEKRDSSSWAFKSWVVGISNRGNSRAYDWNELLKARVINDSLPQLPLVIVLEKDSMSFHAFSRRVNGNSLHFRPGAGPDTMLDDETRSTWTSSGLCVAGPLSGSALEAVQSYQEFWHSWQTFHPLSSRYAPAN